MKSVRWLLRPIIGLFTLVAVGPGLAQAETHIRSGPDGAPVAALQKGLLWKVVGATGTASYVFGTIHSEDPRVTTLPPAVESAFKRSRQVLLEVALDDTALLAMSAAVYATDSRRLSSLVKPELFAAAAQAMATHGFPKALVDRMKPWAVAVTLSLPKPETGLILDLFLYQTAVAQGKSVDGLETPEEQLAVFESLSTREQVTLLRETLEELPKIEGIFEELHAAYLSRDLSKLAALSESHLSKGDPQLAKKMVAELVHRRNRRMVERMLPYVRAGGAFVAVGALHLPGEKGILQGLRDQGLQVSPVY